MTMEERPLSSDFYTVFNYSVKNSLIEAVTKAADHACEAHDVTKDFGANSKTFGYCFYEFVKREFEELALAHPETFKIISRGNWVGLGVGKFELAFYRIGSSERDDISKSFPRNTCGAPKVVQMEMFEESKTPDLQQAYRFILGYMVNPYDGLCAVHIGVPKRGIESNRIEEWAFSEEIWSIDREESGKFPIEASVLESRPEAEEIQEVIIKKRRNEKGISFDERV